MGRSRATLVAVGVVLLVYLAVAWLAAGIEVPTDSPTAGWPWLRPFRVMATIGFVVASAAGFPHLVGQLLVAIVLGGVLGAIYATVRHWLQ